jgi:hypothetical protein
MKLRVLGIAAVLLGLSANAALAASACTAFVRIDEENSAGCLTLVRSKTRDAGFNGSKTGESYFFWFGQDVVSTRCVDGNVIAMAAYHRQDNRACPLLDRIKDVLDNK